eukprot:COSAG02_NODE_5033_length_4710_cov_2.231403_2_plen_67_part_00
MSVNHLSYAEIGAAVDKEIETLQGKIETLERERAALSVNECVEAVLALSSKDIGKFQLKLMQALTK